MSIEKAACLCGAVTITVSGQPINSRCCHCLICQKAMGSPFFARALFEQSNVEINGDVKAYASSPELDRLFCPSCGTSIGARRTGGSVTAVSLVLFENHDVFAPTEQIWLSSSVSWGLLSNDIKSYDKSAPLCQLNKKR